MTDKNKKDACVARFDVFRDGDSRELEGMIMALYQEDPCGETMSLEKIKDTVRELSSHPEKGTLIVFRMGKAVVGYAIVIYHWSNEYGGEIAFVDELFVKPGWRKIGIGSSFIKHIAAAKAGVVRGVLLEVHSSNEGARAFYRSQGFSPVKNQWLFKRSLAR